MVVINQITVEILGKALAVLLLFVFFVINIVSFQQTRNINSAVKTKLAGLLNFLALFKLLLIALGIFFVIIA